MNEYRIALKLMGSAFELVVAHEKEKEARHLLNTGIREIERIENLPFWIQARIHYITNYNEAGINAVPVEDEIMQLQNGCLQVSTITQGAFWYFH